MRIPLFLGLRLVGVALALTACSITATRPVQEMSDTSVAIRAAREVNAQEQAPELFRQATDWYFRAKQEYKLKNFQEASECAKKARHFAEQAEFESIRIGAKRSSIDVAEEIKNPSQQESSPNEKPQKP